jgi:hypothetical protein
MLARPRVLATVGVVTAPIAVGLEHGFAVLWDNQFPDGHISPVLQYFDQSLAVQGQAIILPFVKGVQIDNQSAYEGFTAIVRTPSGFVLYGAAVDYPSLTYGISVFFIDWNGRLMRPRQQLNDIATASLAPSAFNGLAVQPNENLV